MRAHFFQHVSYEGLGNIEFWLKNAGYKITSTKLYESLKLPDITEIDFLVIMGGSMSVNDEEEYPWLAQEKEFIAKFIETGKPVLGICLGAQLIANALGAKVYPSSTAEIGWFPVESVLQPDTFVFPSSIDIFQWHGETFDLPVGARLITRNEACENQGFQIGKSVIALQFHPEMTPELAREIISHGRDELISSKYVQTEEEILSATSKHYSEIDQLMGKVISYLHRSSS